MENMSLISKLETLWSILVNSQEIKYIIPIIIVIGIVSLIISNRHFRKGKWLYVAIYLISIGVIGYFYSNKLVSLLDYLVENIVNNILFPNLALYIAMILVINIIVIVTILSKKVKLYIKNINIFSFSIMQVLLYLIVKNVVINKVDVYEKLSIYTNQELLVLIELSMIFFVVWTLVLILIRLVDILSSKPIKKQVRVYQPIVISNNDDIVQDELIEYVPIKKPKF